MINRSVNIFGPRTLQNFVLSTFISDTGAFPCLILSSLSDVRANGPDDEVLFLVDVSDSTFYLDLLNPLRDTARVALINADDNEEDLYEIVHRFDLCGIFLKNTTPEQLIQGIKAIFSGEYWFSRKLMAKIFRQLKQEVHRYPDTTDLDTCFSDILTNKEVKILQSLVGGYTSQDIADKIFLSPHTVKTHIYNVYKKIGVNNRVQAVNWARKHLKNDPES